MNLLTRTFPALAICLVVWHQASGQFTENQVIAHRGAWKVEGLPQNSLASLNRAVALGCAGSEFDVHLARVGALVVNPVAGCHGMDIGTSPYEELGAKKHPSGESIPTAEADLLEGMKLNKTERTFGLKTSTLGKDRTFHSAARAVQ